MDTFKRDLFLAQIPFIDEFERRADFHALRTSLGTHWAANSMSIYVLKEVMRRSDIRLTLKFYHNKRQLPVAKELALLPSISVAQAGSSDACIAQAQVANSM